MSCGIFSRHPALCAKHDEVQKHKEEEARRKQYAEAMSWCSDQGKGTYAAANRTFLDPKDRKMPAWPLISESGLGRRLKDSTLSEHLYSNRSALGLRSMGSFYTNRGGSPNTPGVQVPSCRVARPRSD